MNRGDSPNGVPQARLGWAHLLLAGGALLSLACGSTLYVFHIGAAEEKVEYAAKIEADKYAPYEYYSAESRLDEAKRQASEAEYGAAADLAEQAERFAIRAIRRAQEVRASALETDDEGPEKRDAAKAPAAQKKAAGADDTSAPDSDFDDGGTP